MIEKVGIIPASEHSVSGAVRVLDFFEASVSLPDCGSFSLLSLSASLQVLALHETLLIKNFEIRK
jgi:hypothetical protein